MKTRKYRFLLRSKEKGNGKSYQPKPLRNKQDIRKVVYQSFLCVIEQVQNVLYFRFRNLFCQSWILCGYRRQLGFAYPRPHSVEDVVWNFGGKRSISTKSKNKLCNEKGRDKRQRITKKKINGGLEGSPSFLK